MGSVLSADQLNDVAHSARVDTAVEEALTLLREGIHAPDAALRSFMVRAAHVLTVAELPSQRPPA